MKITGLVVCVDYADLLERGLSRWRDGLDKLLVVTRPRDIQTQELCRAAGVGFHVTDAFNFSGSVFNKAAALSEAIEALAWEGWFLNFDADVVPPENWRERLEAEKVDRGYLHGCHRLNERGAPMRDGEMAGYFHLWHTSDERVQRRPLWDVRWRHAGGYDSEFAFRWGSDNWRWLPFLVTHLGDCGSNWWGRGNQDAHREMMRGRMKTGCLADCERLDGKVVVDWR